METSSRQKPPFPFPNRPHHSPSGPAHGLPKAADGFLWLLPGLLGPSLKEERAHIFRDPVPTAQGLWSVIYPLTDPRMVATQPLPGGTAFPAFSLLSREGLCALLEGFGINRSGGFRVSFLILTPPGHLVSPRMQV